ncbi:helix-turn-helix transcriptional regulator [Variovorax sp. J22R115]|uniref:helix-turn-helix transcriptional regulator n=1 Tax=Variovorax sp. J22R115 TaxID=3053509 RepID=UPI0034DF59A3
MPRSYRAQSARGDFRKSVKLGLQAVGWLEPDVDSWLAGRRIVLLWMRSEACWLPC